MKTLKESGLKKGQYFRIAGSNEISPELWTWNGQIKDVGGHIGYICTRAIDGFQTLLYPNNLISIVEPLEDL